MKMSNLIDDCGRKIDYLRISITDRCNLRCKYCMPPQGIEAKKKDRLLNYEQIVKIVSAGVETGIRKVRITGGEPLVRSEIINLIQMLSKISDLEEISMTTNGVLLAEYAKSLKEAGLDRVNISLDTLDRVKYREITNKDNFDKVIRGLKEVLKLGFDPVKINTVVMKGVNDNELMDFVDLSYNQPLHVRFIEFMPLGASKEQYQARYISLQDLKEKIRSKVDLTPVTLEGNGPANYFSIPKGKGTLGFINPISHKFCSDCNRLRLTADGKLIPCLDANVEVDLNDHEDKEFKSDNIKLKFNKAVRLKPSNHNFNNITQSISDRKMSQLGG